MPSAVQEVLDILDLEPLEVNLFRGRSPQSRWQRVFGGQVIGQALVAACRTVEDVTARPPHSLHAYFLLGGDPKVPIIYEVDRIRDGKSFTTRNVKAIQHGRAIFSMSVSFHLSEPGLTHQVKMPDVPKPDQLPSDEELKDRIYPLLPEPARRYYERERPIEFRPVEFSRYLGEKSENGRFDIWIRATGRLPDEPAIHQCVLAYASDMMLLDAALIPHGRSVFRKTSWRRASTTRCGSTARSAPTNGCSTPRTAQASPIARFFARPDLCQRRHAGRFGRPGRAAAAAPARQAPRAFRWGKVVGELLGSPCFILCSHDIGSSLVGGVLPWEWVPAPCRC